MKLLILAVVICAANAAVYKPWQATPFAPVQPAVKPVVYKPEVPVVPVPAVRTVSNVNSVVPILRYDSTYNPESRSYNYAYETGNGIVAEASGTLKRVGDADVLGVQGSYQYLSPDGVPVQVSYVADENGFQPRSDLLPVAPPVPEAILRSLAYIAAHPQPIDKKY